MLKITLGAQLVVQQMATNIPFDWSLKCDEINCPFGDDCCRLWYEYNLSSFTLDNEFATIVNDELLSSFSREYTTSAFVDDMLLYPARCMEADAIINHVFSNQNLMQITPEQFWSNINPVMRRMSVFMKEGSFRVSGWRGAMSLLARGTPTECGVLFTNNNARFCALKFKDISYDTDDNNELVSITIKDIDASLGNDRNYVHNATYNFQTRKWIIPWATYADSTFITDFISENPVVPSENICVPPFKAQFVKACRE